MVDYYKILGVARNASTRDINTAYKKLALKYHPDKSDNTDKSLAHFQQIQEAIEVLRDPIKREKYDITEPLFEWEKVVDDIYEEHNDTWSTWDPEDPEYQEFTAWEESRYRQTWQDDGEEDEKVTQSQPPSPSPPPKPQQHENPYFETQEEWRQKRAEAMRARIIRDEENLSNTDEDESEIYSKIPVYEWHENSSTTAEEEEEEEDEEDYDLLQEPRNGTPLASYPLIDLSDPPKDDRSGGQFANGLQELLDDNTWFGNDRIEAATASQQTTSQDPYEQLSRFFEHKVSSGRCRLDDVQAEIVGLYLESMQKSFADLQVHYMNDGTTSKPECFRKCYHLGPWEKHFGAENCELCGRWRPLYTMSCPACKAKACVGCKYEGRKS